MTGAGYLGGIRAELEKTARTGAGLGEIGVTVKDEGALAGAADLLQATLTEALGELRRPAFRAGMGAALITTALMARAGARPGLTIVLSVMLGAAVEKLYIMAEDMHAAITER